MEILYQSFLQEFHWGSGSLVLHDEVPGGVGKGKLPCVASKVGMMEIQYKCGCCGYVYNSKEEALRCESQHESWRNAKVEVDEDTLSPNCCGSPRKIRLRNEVGNVFVYERVSNWY